MKVPKRVDLTGLSPNVVANAHRTQAFTWTYQHGYTSGAVIQQLLQQAASGWAARAERRGWLQSLVPVAGWPLRIYALAAPALELVESLATSPVQYLELDMSRINQALIRHNLLVQQTSLLALREGIAVRVESERQFTSFDQQLQKRPDSVWHLADGRRIGIEVELSGKWGRHLDQFVCSVIEAMSPREGVLPRLDGFQIFAVSPALIDRYRAALAAGAPLAVWGKDNKGNWRVLARRDVPHWVTGRVDFRRLGA